MRTLYLIGLTLAVAVTCAALQSPRRPAGKPPVPPHRILLGNGVTLLLYPVKGTDRVAIETFYRVGFLNEPKGFPQAAHLVEHLVCYSATASYRRHQSFDLFAQKGMINAE